MSLPATAPAASASWHRAFQDLPREHGFEPLSVEGTLPAGLRGTLYRTGPALFSSFGEAYGHWFDGDGALTAVRFEGDTASGGVRLVQSEGLVEERNAGRRLLGSYGTPPPGGPLARLRGRYKNAANTSVFGWNGGLYALFEAGLPTQMDPETLLTIGTTDLEGVIPAAFSAHPHRVPSRRCTYNFGVRFGRHTELDLFALPDGGPARRIATLQLQGPTMIHDFIATENHLVFFAPPLRLQVLKQLLGIGTYSENLAWKPELGTEVIVVPIDDPQHPVRFDAAPFYQWHFSNAFEQGDGRLLVDFVRYPDFGSNEWLAALPRGEERPFEPGRFTRATLDLRQRHMTTEERWGGFCEFPRVAPSRVGREARYAWVAARAAPGGFLDTVARLDVQSGDVVQVDFGAGRYPSEPVFVPRPGATSETDGWALTLVYDGTSHTSHLAVLHGESLEVLARAHFDHHLPFTFHGGFAPAGPRGGL